MNCRWYKEAIIYSLDVDTFKDGNGDGIGDFHGLAQSLPYLSGLGVNCLWLLPFYPSPNRDNGYDVMDYYNVDARLGTLGDFVEFMDEANKHKLRVMTDLVLNHSSNEHPWFKEACRSRSSPFHEYYVWRYDKPPNTSQEAIFPPQQEGIWTYIDSVKGWYLHRFYSHQPDLNVGNPNVRAEMKKIVQFWLELGVSGFRVDAVPYLVETSEISDGNVKHELDYGYLREFRDFLTSVQGDAIMLAEANVDRADQLKYFGDGDRMQMVLNFLVNQRIFLSFASQSAEPLRETLRQMPPVPENGQWGMFLRNHDELSLDRLTKEERELCFAHFAPEERMRIFNRGIRRRLSPILGGDRRKLLLAYSLLFTLPGTPVLWYGEEIGMGENLDLPGRFSVRTLMHWSSERNAGFSSAPPDRLIRPVISQGTFSFENINVEDQERDSESLLNALQQMIRLRQHHPSFGCGHFRLLDLKSSSVLGHCCQWEGELMAAFHNFSEQPQRSNVHIDEVDRGVASEVIGHGEKEIKEGSFNLDLGPFDFRWIRVRKY